MPYYQALSSASSLKVTTINLAGQIIYFTGVLIMVYWRGQPKLHLHAALGRSGKTTTGCLRPGVKTWLVGEVIICP